VRVLPNMFPRDIDQKSHSRLLLVNDHSLYTHMEALGRGMRSRSNRQETLKIGRAPGIRNWHNDLLGRDLGVNLAIDGCSVDPIDVFGGDLCEFVSVHICGPVYGLLRVDPWRTAGYEVIYRTYACGGRRKV